MTSKELNNWGNRLYDELYSKWIEWSNQCKFLKEKGYTLFYSEIRMNPDLMIIGYNPGWNPDFNPNEVTRKVPETGYHDYYAYDYVSFRVI